MLIYLLQQFEISFAKEDGKIVVATYTCHEVILFSSVWTELKRINYGNKVVRY